MSTFVVLGVCSSHAIIALRVFSLWDHRRGALTALWVLFVVTYGCIFTFFVMLVQYLFVIGKLNFDIGIWVSLLAFNIVSIFLTIGSALERPYRQGKEVIDRLKRDGCVSFLILTATCLLNLVMQTVGDSQNCYALFIIAWAIDVSVLSRLVMQMESVKARYTRPRCVSAGDAFQLSDVQRFDSN
ncbi:hypothetical protein BC835DRAFT_1424661 [Cytidiella melzeri]|nr:hypothetical protein BC835DRAFT_1424661 [Cytidiella melzeri]